MNKFLCTNMKFWQFSVLESNKLFAVCLNPILSLGKDALTNCNATEHSYIQDFKTFLTNFLIQFRKNSVNKQHSG